MPYNSFLLLSKVVLKEPSDSKEALPLVDVWRSATTMSGALCVTTSGVPLMPWWPADSWDWDPLVIILFKHETSLFNCASINFIDAVALTTGFTNGIGQIWLDNVQCRGTETRLIDCPALPLGTHNCGHIEDAGVRCVGML